MKQLKKWFMCLVLALCVTGLAACGSRDNQQDSGTKESTQESQGTQSEASSSKESGNGGSSESGGTDDNSGNSGTSGGSTGNGSGTGESNTSDTNNDATTGTRDGEGALEEAGDDIRQGAEDIADDIGGNGTKDGQSQETTR